MRPFVLLFALAACAPEGPLRPYHPLATHEAELRPTDTNAGQMYQYLSTDVVEHFDSPDGGFRVHFTRGGVNAVPTAGTVTLADGGLSTPSLVAAVADVYDSVGLRYHTELGFKHPLSDGLLPDNGGDGRFDVYLLDFGSGADGAFRDDSCTGEQCVGYVAQENDFAGFGYPNATVATRILGSHEYFHGIQAAYDNNQGVVISEGTAVWGTEQYDPSTNDFEGFISGYLTQTSRSIDSPPPGPVPSFAYGSAIFFEYLSEHYEPALIRKLWEHLENGKGHPLEPANAANPTWVIQLDAILRADYASSFADAFAGFSQWNLYMGAGADATRAWANSASYPLPTMTNVTAPYSSPVPLRVFYASTQYYRMPTAGRASMTAALANPATADETHGLVLVIAARQNGHNLTVLRPTDVKAGAESVPTSAATELVVAVVNTAREGNGAILSKRPNLCIGTPDEVALCRGVAPTDAGTDAGADTDAGFDGGEVLDAGVDGGDSADAGVVPPGPGGGCSCGMRDGASPLMFVIIMLASRFAGVRRRAHAPTP